MIKHLIYTGLLFFLFSCSSDSDTPDEPIENLSPSRPVLKLPEDNLECTTNELEFSWESSSDPDEDDVVYIFELSTTGDFGEMYFTNQLSGLSIRSSLDKGSTYHWRVRARDASGNYSEYSAVRSFYTEGIPGSNSLPSVPELVSPDKEVLSQTSINLKWEVSDADGDSLSYDLYFGTSEDPELLIGDLSINNYEVDGLNSGTKYYWKIEAIDEKGGKTIGQVWSFQIQ